MIQMSKKRQTLNRNNKKTLKDTLNLTRLNRKQIPIKPVLILIVMIIVLFCIILIPADETRDNTSQTIEPATVLLGNNSLGSVTIEGPYGNTSSDIKIAYILGVHPREKGAHQLMEHAFKEKEGSLNYCYYIYRVNVTKDPADFNRSRTNGQKLANEYVVPDAINKNFSFAVDAHYSDGSWGVSRFIFTPRENNTVSHSLSHNITDHFSWITYYTPPNPTSPEDVTGPLNDGGVPAVIYEAYTYDDNNTTLEHDRQLITYIDNWNFT